MQLLAMPPARINEGFGEAVRCVLAERGLSLRQARNRTGVDVDTLSRMRQNEVPRLDKVEAFARAFHLDVNEWRQLAGYQPVEDERPALDRVRETARTLTYDEDLEGVTVAGYRGSEVSPEDAEALDRLYRAFLTEQRRKQGRE
jgi:transcriptional regulator with XRE-family HTH domain